MARAKILQKKSVRGKTRVSKNTPIWLSRFLNKIAGRELAIGISIGFVLMSLLMLFANNLKVSNIEEDDSFQIHAAAGDEVFDTIPGIE